jgi:signal transduction histidine kinase
VSEPAGSTVAEPAAPGADPRPDGSVFSDRARVAGLVWVAVAVVLTGLVGTRVETPEGFLALMPLTSSLFTVPAIVVAVITARRVSPPFRSFWLWYLGANIALYHVGAAIVAYAVRPRLFYEITAFLALAVVALCDARSIDHMLRYRSGLRSRSVDVVESGLAIVLVVAPVIVVYGDEIVSSPYAWFGLVSLFFLVLFTSALWCTVVLFVRSPKGNRRAESIGVGLWLAAVLDTVVQIEQVVSGFTLPPAPVLAFNGLCMGFLLLVPLYAPYRHARGLERLPAQAQIRSGKVIAAVTLAALPLLGGAVVVAGTTDTAVRAAGVALGLLVALSAVRQLVTYAETRRLYAEVERSAEDRRSLLAAVLESMDADRQRVAMQLHRQASSSYAALASLVPVDQREHRGVPDLSGRVAETVRRDVRVSHLRTGPPAAVSHVLTERMAAQAESLRELIGAIKPLTRVEGSDAGLAPILQAYVDSLDTAPPAVTRVAVADGLVLDWVTETVALRVVQEAVRNTCRHAEATELLITIEVEDDVPVVRVGDDGVGFDVDAVIESGIATMRRFVEFCGGRLCITSTRGRGTLVEAHLGSPVPEVPRPPRLRPVPG